MPGSDMDKLELDRCGGGNRALLRPNVRHHGLLPPLLLSQGIQDLESGPVRFCDLGSHFSPERCIVVGTPSPEPPQPLRF